MSNESSDIRFGDFNKIFEYLPREKFNTLYGAGKESTLAAEKLLIEEDDTDQSVYLILDGTIEVRRSSSPKPLVTLSAGDWVGEVAFVRGIPRIASAVAMTEVKVLEFSEASFVKLDENLQSILLSRFHSLATERVRSIIHDARKDFSSNSPIVKQLNRIQKMDDVDDKRDIIDAILETIPQLPVYAYDVIDLMLSNRDVPFAELSKVIGKDPTLAADILSHVNSPYYGFSQEIINLQHAVTLLGMDQIYRIVLSNSLGNVMPRTRPYQRLLMHSHFLSIICGELTEQSLSKVSRSFGATTPELSSMGFALSKGVGSTLGLLHDIGKIVMFLIKYSYPQLDSVIEGLDTSSLGELLLASWQLPESLSKSIGFQNHYRFASLDEIPGRFRNNVALLTTSHLLLECIQGADDAELTSPYLKDYLAILGFHQTDIPEIAQNVIVPALSEKAATYPKYVNEALQSFKLSATS